jgi:acyl carrier protein phosphodiesterase
MIAEDCPSDPHHEYVQATTTFESEEVVEEISCESSLEHPLKERFDQFGDDLDLDKLLDHADTFSEPSLEDPLGERFNQIECNLDCDEFLKQAVMLDWCQTLIFDPP